MFDQAPVGVAYADLEGRYHHANAKFARLLGYTPHEVLNLSFRDVTLPEDLEAEVATHRQLITGELGTHQRQKRYRRKDCTIVWTSRTVSLRRDAAGAPLGVIVVIDDISREKEAEAAVRERDDVLAFAMRAAEMAVWSWDIATKTVFPSPESRRLFGVPDTATRLDDFLATIDPADRTKTLAFINEAIARRDTCQTEFRIRQDGGAPRTVSCTGRIDELSGTPRMCCIVQDITARKSIEQQLLQAQKMEAVGQLSGAVAHDFNNVLAVLLMHLQLIQSNADVPPETLATIKLLEKVTNRATGLVRQLLIFSRRHEITPQVLNLNRCVENTCKILGRLVGEHIAFRFEPAPATLSVEADEGMLEQVVMNLCVNARDAMARGGALVVRVTPQSRRHPDNAQPGVAEREYACIEVSDTGCGMTSATRERIFDPFFTTKPAGQGTGLGLPTVLSIAKQHGGWVEVESQVGIGSAFRVFIPTYHGAETKPAAQTGKSRGGSEHVLLVEDDEAVRSVASMCLRALGYHVTEAVDGADAIRLWTVAERPIDLVLTDVVMPGQISGLDLAMQLKRRAPKLKVLVMTGYDPNGPVYRAAGQASFPRLAKPFTATKLLEAVRDVLDQR